MALVPERAQPIRVTEELQPVVRDRARARRACRRPRPEHGRLGPAGGRGRARHDDPAAVRRDARRGRLAARGQPARRAAGHLRPEGGGARGLRAALHLPRLPLRRGDGARRRFRRRLVGRVVHSDTPWTGSFRVLEPAGQPAAAQHRLGPARQLPATSPPTARSATSGSAGWPTRRSSLRTRQPQRGRRRVLHQVDARRPRRAVADGAFRDVAPRLVSTRGRRPRGATPASSCRGRSTALRRRGSSSATWTRWSAPGLASAPQPRPAVAPAPATTTATG